MLFRSDSFGSRLIASISIKLARHASSWIGHSPALEEAGGEVTGLVPRTAALSARRTLPCALVPHGADSSVVKGSLDAAVNQLGRLPRWSTRPVSHPVNHSLKFSPR